MTDGSKLMPGLPEIGHSENYYAHRSQRAQVMGDVHAHAAYKVGQYITLARGRKLTWNQKLKYFRHALERHCNAPPFPTDEVWLFYQSLADLVRQNAGKEAIRLVEAENGRFAKRRTMNQPPDALAWEASRFYGELLGGEKCPGWFSGADFEKLLELRGQCFGEIRHQFRLKAGPVRREAGRGLLGSLFRGVRRS